MTSPAISLAGTDKTKAETDGDVKPTNGCWITCEMCSQRTYQRLVRVTKREEVYECQNPDCRHKTGFAVG